MAEVAQSQPAVVFIGFMAAGKSAAARVFAEDLGTEAVDADEQLEKQLGEPIASFFERQGEAEFRNREEALVIDLLDRGGVIALGGGAVESAKVRDALAGHLVVWCRLSEEDAWARASGSGRPLAADRDEFARRFAKRQPLYEEVARAILPANAREATAHAAPWLEAIRGLGGTRMIWAESASGAYPAIVGEGAIGTLAAAVPDRRRFCIADREVLARHEKLLPPVEATIQIEGRESMKTLTEAEVLLGALAEMRARRDDLILAFGGGVTGDLAGFVAATYQRGTHVAQLPTTVVAQVDSAYGGKTGVDLPKAKNYVGAYHLPLAVLADPGVLATLPPEEVAAGFPEVLKTALIAGGQLWEEARELDLVALVRGGERKRLSRLIFDCARTKIEIVAVDERDAGPRALLNLGHTIGHAIEAATAYRRYRHGEAVGLGLLAALRLSEAADLHDEVRAALERHGLPVALDSAVETDAVLEAAALDKKTTGEGLAFVLLERPGEGRWGEPVDPNRVRDSVEELRR